MTLRIAVPADAPRIAEIEALAAGAPWSEGSLRDTLIAPTTLGWVVGEPPVGHLLTSCLAEEAEILTLAVIPDQRRAGLGGALLAAAEQVWVERGVVAAWLEVRADNLPARRLYERRGWVAAGTRERYYSDGADAQVMRWSPP